MNVVCVRQGEKFGPEYTVMLRRMVREHAGVELKVLGDGEDADWPLEHGLTGWHAKLELLSPSLEQYRPFLYFDLDTFILGGIIDLVEAAEDADRLMLLRDFNMRGRGNSGMMIVPRGTSDAWEGRRTDIPDGDHMNAQPHGYLQDAFSGIVSYKNDCKHAPAGRVVCFHGRPKPHEAEGWARGVWRAYSR